MKKYLSILVIMALTLSMAFTAASCGNKKEEASDDGQNPIMNYVGNYVCGRAAIFIEADGDEGAQATVTWSSSAAENSGWTMKGTFDADSLTFSYKDAVRTDYVYGEDGEVASQTEVYNDGTGTMTFKEGDPVTLTWKDDKEDAAKDMVFEFAGAGPSNGGEEVGMENPWHEAATAEEAAEGAGLDSFSAAEGVEISLGEIKVDKYRYMDGMAEAVVEFPAVEMTIRKGRADLAVDDMGISGDYNEYAHDWTQSVKGLEIHCFGNEEGRATRTIWQVDDTCWSIVVQGLGGDENYGLSADDLNSIINAMQ